jgi:hypothetical protein
MLLNSTQHDENSRYAIYETRPQRATHGLALLLCAALVRAPNEISAAKPFTFDQS